MSDFLKKWGVLLSAFILFFVFKFAFPNPDLFLDSVGYLAWGLEHYPIGYRPMGYTTFLMLFNGMSNVSVLIPWTQFAVFAFCTWYFNTTIFKIFAIRKQWQWVLYILTLFNPLAYFFANFISPDSLFISLSALWLATLLRFTFFEEKKYLQLAIHVVVFICLFYLRYNALYYPFFSAIIIFISNKKILEKALFSIISLALIGILYNNVANDAEENVGIKILSGFGGWAMANNAEHVYNVTKIDSNIFEDPEQRMVHDFVSAFHDSVKVDATGITDQYMWSRSGGLKKYLGYSLQTGRYTDYLSGWWNVSVVYDEYAKTIIKHYPGAFFKGFYWNNFKLFFKPPPEVLDKYNPFNQGLTPEWQQYFDYHEEHFTARYPEIEPIIVKAMTGLYMLLSPLSVLFSLLQIIVFIRYFISQKGKNLSIPFTAAFILASFYLATMALLVFAHPILLRYVGLLLVFLSILPMLVSINFFAKARVIFTDNK